MNRFTLTTVFCLFSAVAFSQHTSKDLTHFTVVDAFGPFDIELIKSDKETIELDYRNIDTEDLIVTVEHEVLKLKIRNRHYFNEWRSTDQHYNDDEYVRVKIYYTDIDGIEVEAGTKVTSRSTLKSKNLDLTANMGAEVYLDLLAQNVGLQSNMGAVVNLSGRTDNLEIKTSMGSDIRADRLEAKKGYIKASMGSEVRAYITEEIDASAGFGAVIDYYGAPSVRHSSSSMGAEIYRSRH